MFRKFRNGILDFFDTTLQYVSRHSSTVTRPRRGASSRRVSVAGVVRELSCFRLGLQLFRKTHEQFTRQTLRARHASLLKGVLELLCVSLMWRNLNEGSPLCYKCVQERPQQRQDSWTKDSQLSCNSSFEFCHVCHSQTGYGAFR